MECKSVSFKSYIPVSYYAKNPATGKYVPVLKQENKRKCNSFVVRNLNSTAKKNSNPEFVNFYRPYDADYRKNSKVRSVYIDKSPFVYLVTGDDADKVNEMAKPIGKAKRDAIEIIGNTNSFEAQNAAHEFFSNIKSFLNNTCKQVKTDDGTKLSLRVYFEPQYSRKNQLKGFKFVNARFIKEEN